MMQYTSNQNEKIEDQMPLLHGGGGAMVRLENDFHTGPDGLMIPRRPARRSAHTTAARKISQRAMDMSSCFVMMDSPPGIGQSALHGRRIQ